MDKKELLAAYKKKKQEIEERLKDFSNIPKKDYLHELIFCLLTPQSQAKKCWEAVVQIKREGIKKDSLSACLQTKTRFHNNKTKYILKAEQNWGEIEKKIEEETKKDKIIELRSWLADNILGLGLKESSHFLRNIGKSNNEVAILDRHILRNLKSLKIIRAIPNLNKKNYLRIEEKFKAFSKAINIPLDYLDLLFWSNEQGSIFK